VGEGDEKILLTLWNDSESRSMLSGRERGAHEVPLFLGTIALSGEDKDVQARKEEHLRGAGP